MEHSVTAFVSGALTGGIIGYACAATRAGFLRGLLIVALAAPLAWALYVCEGIGQCSGGMNRHVWLEGQSYGGHLNLLVVSVIAMLVSYIVVFWINGGASRPPTPASEKNQRAPRQNLRSGG